jgi:peroxiredoxin
MKGRILILLLIAALNSFGQYLPPGSNAIDFNGRSMDGKDFKLSDLKGKYVLLDFTATGCAPCWKSYPHLTEAQKKFKDNLQVVTFHILDTAKAMWNKRAATDKIEVNWIQLWDVKDKEKVTKQYKVDGMPIYYLIDPEGIVLNAWFGYTRKKLDRELNKYLVKKN